MKSLITSSELFLTPWLVQDLMKRSLRLRAEELLWSLLWQSELLQHINYRAQVSWIFLEATRAEIIEIKSHQANLTRTGFMLSVERPWVLFSHFHEMIKAAFHGFFSCCSHPSDVSPLRYATIQTLSCKTLLHHLYGCPSSVGFINSDLNSQWGAFLMMKNKKKQDQRAVRRKCGREPFKSQNPVETSHSFLPSQFTALLSSCEMLFLFLSISLWVYAWKHHILILNRRLVYHICGAWAVLNCLA